MTAPITMDCPGAVSWYAIPCLSLEDFRGRLIELHQSSRRAMAFFGLPGQAGEVDLCAVFTAGLPGKVVVLRSRVQKSFPSLTIEIPQLHMFERELAEQWAVTPLWHPWLKPVRFHPSYRPPKDVWGRATEDIVPGVVDFYRLEGSEIHEVGVGPVHAGIIEPGHFRFQCRGEHVFHLEPVLGYQHRGIECKLARGPDKRTIHYIETLAGDTTIGHSLAYCSLLEALGATQVSPRAAELRALALELERLANHTGDIGALSGDVAYLPTAAYCGRIRGDFLNMTAILCGNRFGRGFIRPGGVAFNPAKSELTDLAERMRHASAEVEEAISLLWRTPSATERFRGCGVVSAITARSLGLVGPAARASGLGVDARSEFPAGAYGRHSVPIALGGTGDVYSRAAVRSLEISNSAELISEILEALPEGAALSPQCPASPNSFAISAVEGWRGEVCHLAITDSDGRFRSYKVVDPSFHNWTGLAMAMRGGEISDFPLNNKSFNLSYCGHDL